VRRALGSTEDQLAVSRATSEKAERERGAAVAARDVFRQQASTLEGKLMQQQADYEAKLKWDPLC
jgi:hypothetical protein